MPELRDTAIEYARRHLNDFQTQLVDLVRIPSISTLPENKPELQRTAEWLRDRLLAAGLQRADILPTAGHPVVVAEWLGQPGAPTVLIYGHYDVQPVDPIDLWKSDPFDPQTDGDQLIGRGASDMKGQVMASIAAVESVLKAGPLPVNVKFMIEGEEEIGSPNLIAFMEANTELLACDVCLNPDAGMIAREIPTLVYGLRGLAYFEIRVYGPDHDLHSGLFGGVVQNPANVLARLIAGMHDENGRVTLPGFYDRVVPLSETERRDLGQLGMDEPYFLKQVGALAAWGEAGYSVVERVGARPTLDVNGLYSGFTGQGSKTIIPAWAMAKVSMRLVPNQDPNEVYQQLMQYLEANAPKTVRWEVIRHSSGPASMSDPYSPAANALADAMETVWNRRPVYKREGGSVPVVGDMQRILGIDSVLTGFGLPDDAIHSPNEKLDLPTWRKGIEALVHFFYNLEGREIRTK